MKVHCQRWWQETSKPSGAGGAANEGESGSARKRAVGIGSRQLARGKKGIWRRDLKGGWGGRWVTWGIVLWQD